MGSSLSDVDCDGLPSYEDCNDRDPNSTFTANDSDCDGIINEEDAFPNEVGESADSDGDEPLPAVVTSDEAATAVAVATIKNKCLQPA